MNFFNDCDLGLYGESTQVSQHRSLLGKIWEIVRIVAIETTKYKRVVCVKEFVFGYGVIWKLDEFNLL